MVATDKAFACPKCGQIIEFGTNPCPYCSMPITWEGFEPPVTEVIEVPQVEQLTQQTVVSVALPTPQALVVEAATQPTGAYIEQPQDTGVSAVPIVQGLVATPSVTLSEVEQYQTIEVPSQPQIQVQAIEPQLQQLQPQLQPQPQPILQPEASFIQPAVQPTVQPTVQLAEPTAQLVEPTATIPAPTVQVAISSPIDPLAEAQELVVEVIPPIATLQVTPEPGVMAVTPEPIPVPAVVPVASPAPITAPAPVQASVVEPVSGQISAQVPAPAPLPVEVPAPVVAPAPTPEPAPTVVVVPLAAPAPSPAPAPVAAPLPEPIKTAEQIQPVSAANALPTQMPRRRKKKVGAGSRALAAIFKTIAVIIWIAGIVAVVGYATGNDVLMIFGASTVSSADQDIVAALISAVPAFVAGLAFFGIGEVIGLLNDIRRNTRL